MTDSRYQSAQVIPSASANGGDAAQDGGAVDRNTSLDRPTSSTPLVPSSSDHGPLSPTDPAPPALSSASASEPPASASAITIDVGSAAPVRKQPYEVLTRHEVNMILFSILTAMFLAALDQNIVVVALPNIVEDLDAGDLLAWVISAYLLTAAATRPAYGRFSDVYGRRAVFLFAVSIFLVGSVLSGAATNIWFLISCRGIQGIGGGGLMSLSMIVVGDIMPPEKRPKYLSIVSSMWGIASIVAPLVGGVVTDQASWRWVFYINVPFCVVSFVAGFYAMRRLEIPLSNQPIDLLGSVLIGSATICIVLFVTWGGSDTGYPWDSWIIIFLIVMSVVFFVAFVVDEIHHPLPLINLRLFKSSNFSCIMVVMFLCGATMLGAYAYLPVFFEVVWGDSALIAGLKLLPMVFGFLFGAGMSARTLGKTGKSSRPLLATGVGLFSVGTGLFALLDVHTNFGLCFLYQILCGWGVGVVFSMGMVLVQNTVPIKDMANALAAFSFMFSMGGAVGVAILGAILNGSLENGDRTSYGAPTTHAMVVGLGLVFAWSVVPAGLAFIISLFISEVQLFVGKKASPDAASNKAEIAMH